MYLYNYDERPYCAFHNKDSSTKVLNAESVCFIASFTDGQAGKTFNYW